MVKGKIFLQPALLDESYVDHAVHSDLVSQAGSMTILH